MQINIARKRHPHKRSKKNPDGLYEVLAPGSTVQKTDQYTSVIREPGKVEVIVRNSNIAKFGTRDERKTQLMECVNRRGPRIHEKTTEAKIFSHIKESTRIQKGDRKMKHRKRETGSGVSSNKSNIARAMRVRMPKIPENFALQEVPAIPETAPEQQIITTEVLIAPPPTNNQSDLAKLYNKFSQNLQKGPGKALNTMVMMKMIHLASQQTPVPQFLFNLGKSDGQAMLSQYNLP